ncbi:hypothetical protein cypCar_00044816, partial [Cyprinus carpio]
LHRWGSHCHKLVLLSEWCHIHQETLSRFRQ